MEKYRLKIEDRPSKGNDYGSEKFSIGGYCSQKEPLTTYAAMVSLLDQQVGEIITKLEEYGIADNTIVMFASDNGPDPAGGGDPRFFNSTGGLKGQKTSLYEGGIRVPFIAKWGNKIEAGSESDHICAVWDMLPTFAEIVGLKKELTNIDGISLLPTLLGKEQVKHDNLYWEFGKKTAVRQGKWKLHENNNQYQLFDLDVDRNEQNNIASSNPEKIEELKKIMISEYSPSPFERFNKK